MKGRSYAAKGQTFFLFFSDFPKIALDMFLVECIIVAEESGESRLQASGLHYSPARALVRTEW